MMKNKELELINSNKLAKAGFEVELRGLIVPEGTDLESFAEVWRVFNGASECIKHCRADLANYAERQLNLSLSELAKTCGEDLTQLSQSARVARRVPLSRRSTKLTYKHTEAIAELEDKNDQLEFSILAEEKDLSPSELREAIRRYKGEHVAGNGNGENQPSLNLPFPHLAQVKNFIARTPQSFFQEPGVRQRWRDELKPVVDFYARLETVDG